MPRLIGAIVVAASVVVTYATNKLLQRKARGLSRQQLLEDIARMRAIHQEDLPF